MEDSVVLEMKGINKSFANQKVLSDVHLRVRKGTVHGLVGENGAGKSTLMKIVLGIYSADFGEIYFKGIKLDTHNIEHVLNSGVSMIHQELSLVQDITVSENIFLGREITKRGLVDDRTMERLTKELFVKIGIEISPRLKMRSLSTAYHQLCEIVKAVSYNSDLIIMDEPTSALSQAEVDRLFEIIKTLKKKHASVIYITHRLDEVFEITDEVTVLKDGEFVDSKRTDELDKNTLINMMVGRQAELIFPANRAEIGDELMSVKNYSRKNHFTDINFCVNRGEILGFSGLMGAGRSELFSSIFGITDHDTGEIRIKGKKVKIRSPHDAIKNGLGLVTEDRKLTGIFPPLSLADNIVMPNLDKYVRYGLVSDKKVKGECEKQRKNLMIKTPTVWKLISLLSGGNQQKAILSRWLNVDPDILVVDEPTRGIDVGAKYEIHKIMCQIAESGKAVIMISSELPEIIGMSDRIIVMHEGRITGNIKKDDATEFEIMKYATGSHEA